MRIVPTALQLHLDGAVTSTCRLLRIQLRDGRVFGVTSLDADVTYNDGRGAVTYSANQGVDPSALSSDSDLSVSNAEAQSLLVTTAGGITEAMIEAGELRDAEWTLYLVNYRDLSNGHVILGAGDIGEVKKRWGLVWMPELLSYSVRLRQPIGTHWSRTCRAIFGSPAEGQTGCGVAADTLWVSGTVSSVGAETDRVFTGSVVAGAFVPGRVEWVSGLNVGRIGIIDSFTAGTATLANAMPYAIANGDTYRIRPDCARTWAACTAYGNQLNFKGEPLIPSGDAASVSTPGAQTPLAGVDTQGGASVSGPSVGTGSGGAAEPESFTGGLLDGYVNAPYLLNTSAREGLLFSTPEANNFWTIVGSTGMPTNVCAGGIPAGFPSAAGAFSYTISAAQWGRSPLTVSGTAAVLASPTATVWNPMDRHVTSNTVVFMPGTAPMLTLQAQPFSLGTDSAFSGRVRALNGYTTGRRYWEVRVDAVPTGTERFVLSVGVDRSVGEFTNSQWLGSDNNAGEWGYVMRRESVGGSVSAYVARRGAANITAPTVSAGSVLRFVHDAGTNAMWIGIAGQGWIGGGNPDTSTAPTISGITPPSGTFWPDYRPVAVLGGGSAVQITANFGSQSWLGGGPTTGATTIPFAKQDIYAHNYPDFDTATKDTGTNRSMITAGISLKSGTYVQPFEFGPSVGDASGRPSTDSAVTCLFHLTKTTGKWQAEFIARGRRDRTYVGVVPFDWVNTDTTLVRPGYTTDSFSVRFATVSNGTGIGIIQSGNTQVGTIPDGVQRITLAFDLDASPKTVRVVRDGTTVGTYNLPTTGKAWAMVVGGSAQGGAEVITQNLLHSQSGFTNWAP